MRWGRLATSNSRPASSRETSMISGSRPSSPSASSAMAKAPIETPGSPFSSRARVPRETPMRSAKSAMGMRRFFLAIRRFRPRVRSERAAEGVIGLAITIYILDAIHSNNQFSINRIQSPPLRPSPPIATRLPPRAFAPPSRHIPNSHRHSSPIGAPVFTPARPPQAGDRCPRGSDAPPSTLAVSDSGNACSGPR